MESVVEEYQGPRPGCFHCKKPIDPDGDYFRVQWLGRTWDAGQNFHKQCLKPGLDQMNLEEAPHGPQ
jgi:hypothetical protein